MPKLLSKAWPKSGHTPLHSNYGPSGAQIIDITVEPAPDLHHKK